ncbi:DUF2628 domain-containing protein [Aureispira anguillae]|uniref:DUF2628 domain-containing protein n=1 Tax=Aureispira anguillae TaxID=2864201 RepID=A0A915YC60_9BACT|nr:DUF2628 domain-containing protein [Aureispira anguillae]BDS10380.1 DUF2628 domain-containing protein [Aureispira anguillae]
MEILDEQLETYLSPEEEDWELFIGPRADYYLAQWQKFERQAAKISLNIPALVFNVYWFVYRKMYRYAIGCVLVFQVLNLAMSSYLLNYYRYFPINPLPYIFCGLLGNWLYYHHAQKKITQIKQQYPNPKTSRREIQATGQTSLFSVFVLFFMNQIGIGLINSLYYLIFFY